MKYYTPIMIILTLFSCCLGMDQGLSRPTTRASILSLARQGGVSIATFAGVVAGLWAAHQKQLPFVQAGAIPFFSESGVVNMSGWEKMDAPLRGFLLGAVVFAITMAGSRSCEQFLRRFLPLHKSDQAFLTYIQKWPAQKETILPELWPLCEMLQQRIKEGDLQVVQKSVEIRDGITLLARIIKNTPQSTPRTMFSQVALPSRVGVGSVVFAQKLLPMIDTLAVMAIAAAFAMQMYHRQSTSIVAYLCGGYVLLRIFIGHLVKQVNTRIQKKIMQHLVSTYHEKREMYSSEVQALFDPLALLYVHTGEFPQRFDALITLLALCQKNDCSDAEYVKQLLIPSGHDKSDLIVKTMTPSLLLIPALSAFGSAFVMPGNTSVVVTTGVVTALLLWSSRLYRAKQDYNTLLLARFEHVIEKWPRYRGRFLPEAQLVFDQLYTEYQKNSCRRPLSLSEVQYLQFLFLT